VPVCIFVCYCCARAVGLFCRIRRSLFACKVSFACKVYFGLYAGLFCLIRRSRVACKVSFGLYVGLFWPIRRSLFACKVSFGLYVAPVLLFRSSSCCVVCLYVCYVCRVYGLGVCMYAIYMGFKV
jgi:hypothetical protein